MLLYKYDTASCHVTSHFLPEGRSMKRFKPLARVILLALTLSACGSGGTVFPVDATSTPSALASSSTSSASPPTPSRSMDSSSDDYIDPHPGFNMRPQLQKEGADHETNNGRVMCDPGLDQIELKFGNADYGKSTLNMYRDKDTVVKVVVEGSVEIALFIVNEQLPAMTREGRNQTQGVESRTFRFAEMTKEGTATYFGPRVTSLDACIEL